MKRFIIMLLLTVFLSLTIANAQVTIVAASTDAFITGSMIEQALYWGQQALDMASQIEQFKTMIENMGKQIQAHVENLNNISKIHSYKDFMAWFNRQLYLERMTEETFKNMNITIGNKRYNITDVEGMAYGFNDTYIDYWNKEFTEEQRREMWTNLGVTPSNYAYIQTWKAREQKIAQEFLAARAIHNEEYKKNMQQNKDKTDALEEDKTKDDSEKMGEKGVAVINAETNIASNKVLNDIRGDLVDIKELKAIEMYQKNTPVDQPPMTEWPGDVLQPLK
jgi:hypothetical protein